MEKKARKVTNGPIRNKERTKQKLLKAVGKILAREGYTGLNTVKIAKTARVDRKLIYNYFGSLEKLIETYFKENDFWEPSYNKFISQLLFKQNTLAFQDIMTILKGQIENMLNNKTFQKTVQWEISEKNKILKKLSDEREQVGDQLFSLTEEQLKGRHTDFRAVMALQIAGIYYLTLHAKINGGSFCGIDINSPQGQKRIVKALENIISNTYGKNKNKQ